eukprot:3704206-Pyramimonas_sp.AAC.1
MFNGFTKTKITLQQFETAVKAKCTKSGSVYEEAPMSVRMGVDEVRPALEVFPPSTLAQASEFPENLQAFFGGGPLTANPPFLPCPCRRHLALPPSPSLLLPLTSLGALNSVSSYLSQSLPPLTRSPNPRPLAVSAPAPLCPPSPSTPPPPPPPPCPRPRPPPPGASFLLLPHLCGPLPYAWSPSTFDVCPVTSGAM